MARSSPCNRDKCCESVLVCRRRPLSSVSFGRSAARYVKRLISGEPDRQHYSKARLSRFRSNLDLAVMLMDDDVVSDMHEPRNDSGGHR